MAIEYKAGHFSDIASVSLGLELWAFLNTPESKIRMEVATFLGRPAVEALAPSLLEAFGDEVRGDRVKQMIGSMVRQVIESDGYNIDRQSVLIPEGRRVLFTSGTRYIKTKAQG